ncbi:zinc finger protein 664-like [Eurosta solidaginis]|uniref:zinc finger protein 664-like n=1 Tax=Eurosta solidaginis TaxID=178769 RepID=UPI003530ED2A
MLKAINTSQTFSNLNEQKCAEIYFRKENCFTIICTLCELKTFDFEEYSLHVKNSHLLTWSSEISGRCDAEIDIKAEKREEQENTLVSDPEIAALSESEDVPLSNFVNFSANKEKYEIAVDIVDNRNNEWSNEESEDNNNHDTNYIPRILRTEKTSKKTISNDFQCNQCKKSYKHGKNLDRHIKQCHSSEPSEYCCVRCKQNFRDERTLHAHQRKKYAGYPCAECDKVYLSKESLNIHSYRHTGVRNFHCNVKGCGKSFFNPKNLAMHTRMVHRMEKNFVCEICGFRTKGQPALIVHKRSHTGEKPFKCKLCGKGFASKSLLCEHEPAHSTERPHVCNVCGRSFSRPKALYHHKYLHLDIKKFVCKLCGRAYAQMAGLAGHMRQHKAVEN